MGKEKINTRSKTHTEKEEIPEKRNIVVLADGVGGFKFSQEAIEWLATRGENVDAQMIKIVGYHHYNMGDKYLDEFEIDIERHDPKLIELISALGVDRASGTYSKFRLVHIPDHRYTIVSHGTYETIYHPSYSFEKMID